MGLQLKNRVVREDFLEKVTFKQTSQEDEVARSLWIAGGRAYQAEGTALGLGWAGGVFGELKYGKEAKQR